MPEDFSEQDVSRGERTKNLFMGLVSRTTDSLFYLIVFLFPIFALPYTNFPVAINKSYLVYFSILLLVVIYLASALRSGRILVPKNLWSGFLIIFLAGTLASSFFSKSPHVSFFGLASDVGSLGALTIFVVALFLAFSISGSEGKGHRFFLALGASFIFVFVFQFFQTILKIPLWPTLGRELTFNLFGSWNELGIFSGLMVLIAAMFAEALPSSPLKIISLVMLAMALILTALVNLNLVWWTLAALLVVHLAYLYSQRRDSRALFKVPFGVLIIIIIFIFTSALTADLINSLGIQFLEIRPSFMATLEVAQKTLGENLLGYGPNTFVYAWFQHRPDDIVNTSFWQTRFNSGFGFIPTMVTTNGVISVLAFLAFLALFLFTGFKALVKASPASFLLPVSFLGALYLWIFAFIYAVGFPLVFLAFLMSGVFLGLAARRGATGSSSPRSQPWRPKEARTIFTTSAWSRLPATATTMCGAE